MLEPRSRGLVRGQTSLRFVALSSRRVLLPRRARRAQRRTSTSSAQAKTRPSRPFSPFPISRSILRRARRSFELSAHAGRPRRAHEPSRRFGAALFSSPLSSTKPKAVVQGTLPIGRKTSACATSPSEFRLYPAQATVRAPPSIFDVTGRLSFAPRAFRVDVPGSGRVCVFVCFSTMSTSSRSGWLPVNSRQPPRRRDRCKGRSPKPDASVGRA